MRYVAPFSMIVAVLAFTLAGCGSKPAGPASSDLPSAVSDMHGEHDHGGHDEGAAPTAHSDHAHGDHAHDTHTGQSDMDQMMAELARLSPEDRASAEKQHICPVSGEMLGMMGPPLKIDVIGQQVWICCEDCKEELLANPDKYLTTLHEGSSHE